MTNAENEPPRPALFVLWEKIQELVEKDLQKQEKSPEVRKK